MEANNTEARRAARLKRAFTAEERASLKLLTTVRLIVIAAVIVFLLSRFPDASGLYWSALTLSYAMMATSNTPSAVRALTRRGRNISSSLSTSPWLPSSSSSRTHLSPKPYRCRRSSSFPAFPFCLSSSPSWR